MGRHYNVDFSIYCLLVSPPRTAMGHRGVGSSSADKHYFCAVNIGKRELKMLKCNIEHIYKKI